MIIALLACHTEVPKGPHCPDTLCASDLALAGWTGAPETGTTGHTLETGVLNGQSIVLAAGPVLFTERRSHVGVLDAATLKAFGDYTGPAVFGNGLAIHPEGTMFAIGDPIYQEGPFPQGPIEMGAVWVFDAVPNGHELQTETARLSLIGTDSPFAEFGLDVALLDVGHGVELLAPGLLYAEPPPQQPEAGILYAFDPTLAGQFGSDVAHRRIRGQPGLGQALAGWDSDADGQNELVASDSRAVHHFPDTVGDLTDNDADVSWTERYEEDGLGVRLFPLQDLDGDGKPELAIAAHTETGEAVRSGTLYVVPGGPLTSGPAADLPLTVNGTEMGEATGIGATSGDFDGDGVADLAVGAPGVYPATDQKGKVLGFLGPVLPGHYTAADADFVVHGDTVFDQFGWALVTVDADGDAQDDLVVGAPGYWGGRGFVYLLAGADLVP